MEILKVNKDDIEAIYKIDNFNFTYDSYNKETILKLIIDNNVLFLKIIDNNILIGYSILQLIKPEAELLKICINDHNRNRGFGKLLIDYNINYLKNNYFNSIFLEVRSDNLSAIRFYEKFGFVKFNIRKNYYKKPDCDALLYKLSII